MNIFRSKKLTKIVPLLTARYTFLCTRRLQPPRDDCAVREQWFFIVKNRYCNLMLAYINKEKQSDISTSDIKNEKSKCQIV